MATTRIGCHLRRAPGAGGRAGTGRVSPNPMVGAVIVARRRGDRRGLSRRARWAARRGRGDRGLPRARDRTPPGRRCYVTLEPCAHHGRQPPCTDAIRDAGIARVVIGSDEDPSEKATGRGPDDPARGRASRSSFVDGAGGRGRPELLNQPFRKHARTGRPLVTLKSAISLDGFTATAERRLAGGSPARRAGRWSTAGARGRRRRGRDRHRARRRPAAHRAGVWDPDVQPPMRVVFDSEARLPAGLGARGSVERSGAAYVVVAAGGDPGRGSPRYGPRAPSRSSSPEIASAASPRPSTSWPQRHHLAAVEGGATLAGSLLRAGEVDELRFFIAPVVLGGGLPLASGWAPSALQTRRGRWPATGSRRARTCSPAPGSPATG